MKKKLLSLVMALVLAVGLLPMGAMAGEDDSIGTVTFSIETKTIDGKCLVEPMEEELYSGDTVYTILTRVAAENNLTVAGADAGYVTQIGDFSAFGYGDQSGWMVAVNNDHTSWPLPELKNGDSIRFCYTYLTYGCDIDLIDLVDELTEKVTLAADYSGENTEAVASAMEEASSKLTEIYRYESNQAYLNAVTIYGDDSETSEIESLIEKLNTALKGGPVTPDLPFTDVDGHWALDAIRFVYDQGLMTGTKETQFSPNKTLNRAMLATILYRMEGSPAVTGENPFTDVAAGTWYTDAVLWASEQGIVNGYGNGAFGPLNNITREQLAAMLLRYSDCKKYDTTARNDLTSYADADDISPWALEALQWANAQGLVNGRTETTLVPQGDTTRAETATVLMRYLDTIAG